MGRTTGRRAGWRWTPGLVAVLGLALGGCAGHGAHSDGGVNRGGNDGGVRDAGVGDAGSGDGGGADGGGVHPDPTLLPSATLGESMDTAAYGALHVPALAAGDSYRDPTTNVQIYKLTSSSFPASGGVSFGHDYFEGNYEVSLPYTADGKTRAVLVFGSNDVHYLIDFTPGVGVGNPRPLTGSFKPNHDIAFTFSDDPATPYYAYVLNGTTLRRIDIRTMTEAPGGGFPVTGAGTSPIWLQQSVDDGEFVWMSSPTGPTVYHDTPATKTLVQQTDSKINEPRIDRAGRYVVFSMDTPQNGLEMWDTKTNTVTWTTDGTIPMAHQADLQDLWVANDWNKSYPFSFDSVTPTANSLKDIWGPSVGNLPVGNGGWNQFPTSGDQRDAWTVWNSYGSLKGTGGWAGPWLAPGGIVLMTVNGGTAGAKLLAFPYSTQSSYWVYAWPKFTADGRYVVFTSDMNGSGRYDLFLAVMPTSPGI